MDAVSGETYDLILSEFSKEKKSVALSVKMQAIDHTLTDHEIEKIIAEQQEKLKEKKKISRSRNEV